MPPKGGIREMHRQSSVKKSTSKNTSSNNIQQQVLVTLVVNPCFKLDYLLYKYCQVCLYPYKHQGK